MTQSFGIVEEKVFESEFFLEKLRCSSSFTYDSRYYFSAFVSASRSITLSLQATLHGVDEFSNWYEKEREKLKIDPLAPLFVEIRNDVIHKGINVLNRVSIENLREHLFLQLEKKDYSHVMLLRQSGGENGTELVNAMYACDSYFFSLVELIYNCYDKFKVTIDPQWYFTQENFNKNGKGIEDALFEMGFPITWLKSMPDEVNPWRVLRSQQPTCILNELFHRHLGKVILSPDEIID
jgi:hypothetical protein